MRADEVNTGKAASIHVDLENHVAHPRHRKMIITPCDPCSPGPASSNPTICALTWVISNGWGVLSNAHKPVKKVSSPAVALAYGPEQVLRTLQAVSTMLNMPIPSDSFREVTLAASDRLFCMSPDTLHQRVTFFCQTYATGTHVARTALTRGVFLMPEPVMQRRAAKLQQQLGWDSEQLKQRLSAEPKILTYEPVTLAKNIHDMQGAGFCLTQVWAMCTQHPTLLAHKWTSDINIGKLQFLTCLLGLSLDDIAAKPHLLAYSASSHLGPRVWFMYQTGAIEAPNTVMTSGFFGYVSGGSKAQFASKFKVSPSNPNAVTCRSPHDRIGKWEDSSSAIPPKRPCMHNHIRHTLCQ